MKKNIFYLAGFMGAGKSTIGPILANTMGWDFFDLDKMIEQQTGKKITEIFAESGESYFRKLETETLIYASAGDNLVISVGGGTISSGDNLGIMKRNGTIFYLKTSVEAVYKRLIYKNDRPMLKVDELTRLPDEEIIKKLNTIFEARKPYYEKADYIIETENVSVGKTVDRLAKIINNISRKEQN
jgi:shikimate kinase